MNFKLELSRQETELVLGILQEHPYKLVFGIIGKIQAQASVQMAQPADKQGSESD